MCPIAKAIVNTVNPKASDTPSSPMPTFGNAAARTALPHPPNTSQNVPTNSAIAFLPMAMVDSLFQLRQDVRLVSSRCSRHGLLPGEMTKRSDTHKIDQDRQQVPHNYRPGRN